jgi:hypothetical protein
MATNKHLATIEEALASLKDFQRVTVDTVYARLFTQKQKSMLVADEVGLGKTVVAKGIIATALRERRLKGDSAPFKVTYICSNQVIAGENIGKLNVFPERDLTRNIARRVAYLAYEPESNSAAQSVGLVLNTLTPATSFDISQGVGNWYERAIIYSLLCTDPKLASLSDSLACLLRGGVRSAISKLRVDFEEERAYRNFRSDLPDKLHSRIGRLTLKEKDSPLTWQLLKVREDHKPTIYEATRQMAGLLHGNNEATHRRACNEVARVLRRALIDSCLDYIDADLFILDEFQRFRNLIDPHSQDEEAVIAKKIFRSSKARILLLSATPFKAFTGDMDNANGEDHYRDFKTVLEFLTNEDEEVIEEYERHRTGLYRQLLNLQKGESNISTEHRDGLESILRSIICRTERQIVAADPGAMIKDNWSKNGIPCGLSDIQNFVATDQVAWALGKVAQGRDHAIAKPIEYCKSSPHPLSFLDGYALKDLLKLCRRNEVVHSVLKQYKNAWLNVRAINRYKLIVGQSAESSGAALAGHARLTNLVAEAVGPVGAQLLWIPPSLSYYPLEGGFKDAAGFSKTLVFSGWVMVPRMIATMVSYEVERRTIGNDASREAREKDVRKYFPPKKEQNYRRHPVPLLVFRSEDGDTASARSMSNFCCLYPSPTLAGLYDPFFALAGGQSLAQLRQELRNRIAERIKQLGLSQYETAKGSSDRWYWAAPLLLDHPDRNFNTVIKHWLNDDGFQEDSLFHQSQDGEQSGKRRHFAAFRDAFMNPAEIVLGRMPDDLPDVLADMALGSPAIAAFRTLLRLFPSGRGKVTKHQLRGAFEIAVAFLNLFNKPESICAVRLTCPSADYWRQVLRYCADGCLQAVLDEYGHLTKDQKRTMEATITRLQETVNITATSVNVDSLNSFLRSRPHKMRCHYAVDFGNQKLETEQGQERATSIRENFNSPFRPFVLATTSIGQEGLDFHQYCRKIVHWNLPGNPIDLEQREGRINRYKGLVIRQEIARKYGSQLTTGSGLDDPWVALFTLADHTERVQRGKCELVPYWYVDADHFKIERIIPLYPFSRDHGKLAAILKTLAIYRLAFGQPRQVELIEHLLQKDFSPEEIALIREKLMIDLSPISYRRTEKMGSDKDVKCKLILSQHHRRLNKSRTIN